MKELPATIHPLVYLDYRVRLFATPLGCFCMGATFRERGLPWGWLALALAYRLLDQTNYRKSLDQLVSLLRILDCEVDLVVRARSA